MEFYKGHFIISTDKSKIDLKLVHDFLTHSYWAAGIPIELVQRSIENSLCFGIYNPAKQIGFAKVVSDFATYTYLADVFVLEEERGKSLAKWLVSVIKAHPQLQGVTKIYVGYKRCA
ncbi:MAG TPA: GNAT family N-acetyltransferase [Chitinophagaceae bacterium]|nr:GNAT family N-acetyltransferase [Chitinophagaceae bacterium]